MIKSKVKSSIRELKFNPKMFRGTISGNVYMTTTNGFVVVLFATGRPNKEGLIFNVGELVLQGSSYQEDLKPGESVTLTQE